MNKQQKLIIGISALVLFIGIGTSWLFWWGRESQNVSNEQNNQSKANQRPQRTLPEEKRPKIDLEINSDRSGAVLTVSEIVSDFVKLEYELIYLAESDDQEIERGVAGGPIEIPESRTVSEDLLFGTESCTTGVCHRRIDKNVSGGTLIIRLIDTENQSWSIEKEFTIEKTSSGYKATFVE